MTQDAHQGGEADSGVFRKAPLREHQHRLGVYAVLGRSFKTTNCLESVNALVEERCAKVDHWKNSSQSCRPRFQSARSKAWRKSGIAACEHA